MNFREKLNDIASEACESDCIQTIADLLDTLTSLLVFAYVKTSLKNYKDFENKINKLLKEAKEMLLDKYQKALFQEL